MDVWAAFMLVSAGAFAGGAASFAWSRVPIWRSMEPRPFRDDFSATITRTDKVQPALLVVAILSTIAFAVAAESSASAFAWIGAAGFSVTLGASAAVLVPLQRRIIIDAGVQQPDFDAMRARWFRGHLGRSVLSMASFASTVLAVTHLTGPRRDTAMATQRGGGCSGARLVSRRSERHAPRRPHGGR